MTRFFTTLLLLWGTLPVFSQKPLFKGEPVKNAFENSPELTYQFQEFAVYELDMGPLNKYVKGTAGKSELSLQFGTDYQWDISLEPHDLRRPGHVRRWVTADGVVSMPPAENVTFRGTLNAPGGRSVSLAIDEEYLRGFIKTADEMYYIEPVWYFVKGQPKDLYVVYPASRVRPRPDAKCGYTELLDKTGQYIGQPHQHEGQCCKGAEKAMACKEVEIAIASDWLMHQQFGSAAAVEAFEAGTLANVQTNYDDEFNDDLIFTIVEFFTVTTSNGDPWTNSTNASVLLGSFTAWGPSGFSAIHDIGGLWTDRDFAGSTIGIAWVGSVCTSQRYHCLQNFSTNANFLRVVWAHEMGHNFNADHDAQGSNTIMAPSVNSSTVWSAQSQSQINGYIASIDCLGACGGASAPVAAFSAAPTEGCAPLTVQFTDQSQFGPTSWNWTFSGGTPGSSTQQNPTVVYSTPGIYDVTLTVSNSAGTNSVSMLSFIEVQGTPTPLFTYNQVGLTVALNNLSVNANTYLWNFGDGNTSTESDPVHTYAQDGFYEISLTAFNACGGEEYALVVPVFTFPVASFTAAPTAGCANLTVEFMSTSSSNTTAWLWEFQGGNPATSTQEDPTVTYTTPGQYDVTLTAFNPAGSHTFSLTDYITVGTVATPAFSSAVNGLTVSFTNQSNNSAGIGNMTFSWNFGDGNASTETNPVHTYATSGTYTVTLQVSNTCGTVSIAQAVTIQAAPVANFSAPVTSGCGPLTVEFMNQSAGAASFLWSFPGGSPNSSTLENPTVVYNTPGSYDVTLVVTNSIGSDTLTLTNFVSVTPPSVPAFSSTMNGRTVFFTNNSLNANSYNWDFGDGSSSTEANPTHTYQNDGTYTVVLTATNACGPVSISQAINVVTAPTAAFTANNTSGCAPLTVQFISQSSANTVSYLWSFPGGNPSSSTDENPMVTYAVPGTYDATLTVSNTAGSNSVTQTNFVVVNGGPAAGFGVATNVFVATFSNTSVNGTSFNWDFGDGTSSTETNPVHTYPGDGTYIATLTATNACDTSTSSQTVVITSLPQAGFSAQATSGCAPFTVQFNDQSSSNTISWEWSFPGGSPSSSTEQNPTVTYNTPGTYSVSLTAGNALGENTATQTNYIQVLSGPTAGFSSTQNGLAVVFANSSTNANTYSWDFGDGTNSTETNPAHTYPADGSYTVVLTVGNACGQATFTQTLVVATAPTAAFSANATEGCAPFNVQFTSLASSNTTAWEWSFPGGSPASSTDENPVVTYNTPGIYNVGLTASNSAGEDEALETDFITVGGLPVSSFNIAITGFVVDFTNNSTTPPNSGTLTYNWDFGDGNTSTEANPQHTYSADGTYDVALTATNDCGSKTINGQVTVVSAPTAAFTADVVSGCAPLTVVFTNGSSANAATFSWQFPGGTPAASNAENPVVTYSQPGTFDVILTVSNAAGSDMVSQVGYIIVNAGPTASFEPFVLGQNVQFNNQSSGFTGVEWDFGDGTTSTENAPSHSYEMDGAYTVTLTVTNECGSSTYTQIVVIATQGPVAAFTVPEQEGCAPFTVTFENLSSSNSESFKWEFEGATPAISNETNPSVTYSTPGVYSVSLTAFNALGENTFTQTGYITVVGLPAPGFSAEEDFLTVHFTNNSTGAASYTWDFGDGSASNEANPSHTYAAAGEYQVTLTATNECGNNSLTQTVAVMPNAVAELPGIRDFRVFPNPNNGRFTMILHGEALADLEAVFTNVLGQMLHCSELDFSTGQITKEFAFDGLPAGVYIFQLKSGEKALHRKLVVE